MADPVNVLLTVVLVALALFVLVPVGAYVYAAKVAAAEGRTLGAPKKKLGAKKLKRMTQKRGLMMPSD